MGNKRYIVDSNVFIAAYLEKDTQHEKALSALLSIEANEVILPYCIISEVCTVLTYKESKKRALEFLETVEKANHLLCINNEYHSELNAFKKINARVSFEDCSLLYLCELWKAELVTFDEQLLKLYKKSKSS
jgi:predicted nucleic acid-binding protein